MAIIDWETEVGIIPDTCEFGIYYNSLIHTSPLNGITQSIELPGARWRVRLSFKNLEPAEGRVLIAFLTKLRGSAGRFSCYDFGRPVPRGNISGTISIDNILNKRSLEITGGTGNLEIGDYLTIGASANSDKELKMITGNPSGNIYEFEPALRKPIVDYTGSTATLDYTKPTGVFMLSSDEQAYWSTRSKGLLTDIDIEAIEIILPAGVE